MPKTHKPRTKKSKKQVPKKIAPEEPEVPPTQKYMQLVQSVERTIMEDPRVHFKEMEKILDIVVCFDAVFRCFDAVCILFG